MRLKHFALGNGGELPEPLEVAVHGGCPFIERSGDGRVRRQGDFWLNNPRYCEKEIAGVFLWVG